MTVRASFVKGIRKVRRTKRMIFFAWLLNVLLTAVVAIPMLALLEEAIGPTVMEERLLEQLDLNWFSTFRADHDGNPIGHLLTTSMLGAAPFYSHADDVINGRSIVSLCRFFGSLLFEFRVNTDALTIEALLVLLYMLGWTYLSGGFIGVYARDNRSSFGEFLQLGARYFGKFFRLLLMQLILYFLLYLLVEWISRSIRVWTADEASELTAFVYFMIRNAVVVLVIGILTMIFDYAKIRMVVDNRVSALAAVGAGVRFIGKHPLGTGTVAIILAIIGTLLAFVFVLVEAQLPQSTFWMILVVFILQQLYVWSRQWLRAAYYATQTSLYQGWAREWEAPSAEPTLSVESKTA